MHDALVSSALNFQSIVFTRQNTEPYVDFLPSFAATAWYHKKLPADSQSKNLSEVVELRGHLRETNLRRHWLAARDFRRQMQRCWRGNSADIRACRLLTSLNENCGSRTANFSFNCFERKAKW